ncbi:MAG: tRNA pseudouridine(55) synthase TruB [bacterium]|nr:tRNA pseudouridine(55) synthase TruB [bacterium]
MPLLQSPLTDVMPTWIEAARTTGAAALIDKEETWTSFDVVAKLRHLFKVRRVGHAGTLDPLATGLLVLCFGPATKQISLIQDADKAYDVVVKLGATTSTDDRGSEETIIECEPVSEDRIKEALLQFVGTIEQTPPAFAAIRHQGRRQYDLAREGIAFEERKRTITVHAIDGFKYEWPFVHMSITCTKGTYIRSIARDLGAVLGVGGYVWTLRRTAIGALNVTRAVTVRDIQDALMVSAS